MRLCPVSCAYLFFVLVVACAECYAVADRPARRAPAARTMPHPSSQVRLQNGSGLVHPGPGAGAYTTDTVLDRAETVIVPSDLQPAPEKDRESAPQEIMPSKAADSASKKADSAAKEADSAAKEADSAAKEADSASKADRKLPQASRKSSREDSRHPEADRTASGADLGPLPAATGEQRTLSVQLGEKGEHAGTVVRWYAVGPDGSVSEVSAVADKQGVARVKVISAHGGDVEMTAVAPDGRRWARRVHFPDRWTVQGARTVPVFSRKGGQMSFLVRLKKNGRPEAGAAVKWYLAGEAVRIISRQIVADAEGIAKIVVAAPPGRHVTVTAEAEDGTRLVGKAVFERPAGQPGARLERPGEDGFVVVGKAAAARPAQLAFPGEQPGQRPGPLLSPGDRQKGHGVPGLPGLADASHSATERRRRGYVRVVSGSKVPLVGNGNGKGHSPLRPVDDKRHWLWRSDYSRPVYEHKRHSVLCELGARSADNRPLADVGLVYRHVLSADDVVGLNLFVDQDLHRGHTGASLGVEAMGSGWQISSNYYVPFSRWKKSTQLPWPPLFTDSENFQLRERLVRKRYDVSLEAFLPGYRPLSVRARYARSFGEQIDGSGWQQYTAVSPVRFEGWLNWRPLQLVKLSVGQLLKTGFPREPRMLLELGFNLDQSLIDQLRSRSGNTKAGAPSRTGILRQFVDRNADMTLQYRAFAKPSHGIGSLDVHTTAYEEESQSQAGHKVTVVARVRHTDAQPAAGVPLQWTISPSMQGVTVISWQDKTDERGAARIIFVCNAPYSIKVDAAVAGGG